MSTPALGEIKLVSFNFAPKGWALCNGQLLPISQNTALFSLLGTRFGGDGKSTFGLPDMMDSIPINFGQGDGLSSYELGESGGISDITLQEPQMPAHAHVPQCFVGGANSESPTNAVWTNVTPSGAMGAYATPAAPFVAMDVRASGIAGGSLPHNNMMPGLGLSFCIALQGVFPARS